MNSPVRAQCRCKTLLAAGFLALTAATAAADGMVFPQQFFPKVAIPNQQALIAFSNGVERLVIETAFWGEGTNFAWVVPLPSAPEVKPVSENFFNSLRRAFMPRLIHEVTPYYASVLFVCGLVFLGTRAMKDEVLWLVDLPLCVVLGVGAGVFGRHFLWGLLGGGLALYLRILARTPASVALGLLTGLAFSLGFTVLPRAHGFGLVQTLGGEGGPANGVEVLSVQHAGVFDSTTIRGDTPGAVFDWLKHNGYGVPLSAEGAIRYYQEHGWVFVANRVARAAPELAQTSVHPLLFTFATQTPVYPMRLTAVENGRCAIDLYVFGDKRSKASHLSTVRCERLAGSTSARNGLRLGDPELGAIVGSSAVGTKLSAVLNPDQMASDVTLLPARFSRIGSTAYSSPGAINIALNIALPIGAIGWLLLGASQGGWDVRENTLKRWRRWFLVLTMGFGLAIFIMLPKVEVESRPAAFAGEY